MMNTLIDFLDRETANNIENKLLHNEVIKPEITKPEKIKKKTTKKCVDFLEINYDNFLNGKNVLGTYKVLQLKDAIKKYKLPLTGSKTVLITRLTDHFHKIKKAILIQKTFRKHMVCLSFRIRGPAYKNKKLCVNDTDFVTMEPLEEITMENFFSYQDSKNFIYGFNISSLIQIFKKNLNNKNNIINPYNREKMTGDVIASAITLYRIAYIIYPVFRAENEGFLSNNRIRRYNVNTLLNHNTVNAIDDEDTLQNNERVIMSRVYRPRLIANYTTNQENYIRYNKIQQIRLQPIHQRINELFIEVDQLGNYTRSEWFSSLNLRAYQRLYRCLYEIWMYRSGLTNDVKIRISPFHGPFDGIFNQPPQANELTLEQMKLACLIVFENLVYSGIDEDHRKIGCFHALSALTVVSPGARDAMPWLYESVVY